MIRRLKVDVLDQLPPKKRQKIEIDLDSKLVNEIKVLLNKAPKFTANAEIDFDKVQQSENVIEKTLKKEEDSQLNCFNKAYLLTGEAKIKGIIEYIKILIESIFYLTQR
jgi:hypothetical protein